MEPTADGVAAAKIIIRQSHATTAQQLVEARAELEAAHTLIKRLTRIADHGGPSNWRTFVDDEAERALVIEADETP